MKTRRTSHALAAGLVLLMAPVYPALAQAPGGAPDATRTIDGRQLPAPPMDFGGKIENDALSSTPWWAPQIVPPSLREYFPRNMSTHRLCAASAIRTTASGERAASSPRYDANSFFASRRLMSKLAGSRK